MDGTASNTVGTEAGWLRAARVTAAAGVLNVAEAAGFVVIEIDQDGGYTLRWWHVNGAAGAAGLARLAVTEIAPKT